MDTESTLSSYRIFNTVAETGNLSKAAKALYISQPAISRAVSKLEQTLSVKLFIRGSRGVSLTEEGKLLYEHTKSAFDALRRGEENLRRIQSLGAATLRIGVSTTLCKHLLMPQLQAFIQEHPHIKINICCHSTGEIMELLEDNKIDIGLISRPNSLHNLEFFPVTEVEDIFVATEGYLKNLKLREQKEAEARNTPVRKNRRPAEKKAADSALSFFRNGTLLLPDEKHISRLHIEDYFNKNQIETGQILEFGTMDMLIDFSKIGLGIGCVVKEFVEQELRNHSLIELILPVKPEKRSIGFAYNKTTLQAAPARNFIDYYKGGIR